jgi:hypothetical protein
MSTPAAVRDAVETVLRVIEAPPPDAHDALVAALDQLLAVSHGVSFEFDATPYDDPPHLAYDSARQLVTARFPDLGLYNVPAAVTRDVGTTDVLVGDAVDGLADIFLELRDVEWRFRCTSAADALWHLEDALRLHLAAHIRWLQVYFLSRTKEA